MMFSYDVICSSMMMMMMMIIIYEKRSFFSHAYVEIMSCMCLCDIRIIGEKILKWILLCLEKSKKYEENYDGYFLLQIMGRRTPLKVYIRK